MQRLEIALPVEACWHRVPGGTARAVVALVNELATRPEVLVHAVAARHRTGPHPEFSLPQSLPVVYSHLPRRALYEYWHRNRSGNLSRLIGATPDVVHAAGGVMPPAAGSPLVATIHDLAFVHRPEHFTKNGVYFLNRALDIARSEAAAVICPSTASASDCVDAGIDADRVHILPLGVTAPIHDRSSGRAVVDALGIKGRYILWVGTIEPRKNLPRLIDAFIAGAPADVQLVLAGPDGWMQDLDGGVPAANPDRVHATGFVSADELSALYAAASVVCVPSLLEGFGFPVVEAMAHGTPVITSKGTSTEELIADCGVLVEPTDIAEIAEALAFLLDDEAEAQRLGEAGRARSTRFSWETYADQLISIYQDVTA